MMDPKAILISISDRCNELCSHCYIGEKNRRRGNFWEDLDFFKKILEMLAEENYLFLTLTGGEPLLNPHFFDFVKIAKELSFYISIKTNGQLIDEKMTDKLKKSGVSRVDLSIYYPVAEEHDHITNVKGSFDRTIAAADFLKSRNIKFRISSPLLSPLPDLEKLYSLSKELGADLWLPDPFIFLSRDVEDEKILNLRLKKRELEEFVDYMISKDLYKIEEFYNPERQTSFLCGIGETALSIDVNGNAYFCDLLREPKFSLRDYDIKQVKESALPLRREIKLNRECNNCSLFKYCSPCPAISDLEDGSPCNCTSIRKSFAEILKDRCLNKGGEET